MNVPAETPLGNALARMGSGECCAVHSVLVCPRCKTVYCDDRPGSDDTGWCGMCRHDARYLYLAHPGLLRRRERRPTDDLSVSFRW